MPVTPSPFPKFTSGCPPGAFSTGVTLITLHSNKFP